MDLGAFQPEPLARRLILSALSACLAFSQRLRAASNSRNLASYSADGALLRAMASSFESRAYCSVASANSSASRLLGMSPQRLKPESDWTETLIRVFHQGLTR